MWLIVSYAGSVVVNNGVLCWASGCETLWVMLSSVCRNHGVLCWASRCESLIVMLNQWLWIMVGYSVLVNTPGFTTTGSASLNIIHTYWHSVHIVITNDYLSIAQQDSHPLAVFISQLAIIAHHDSQRLSQHNSQWFITLAQYNTTWLSTSGSTWASRCESLIVMLNQWLWIMVGYSVLVGLNHGELCWARGWQSCCIILSQCYESLWATGSA
jgi:hypothetical protein